MDFFSTASLSLSAAALMIWGAWEGTVGGASQAQGAAEANHQPVPLLPVTPLQDRWLGGPASALSLTGL